MYCKKKLSSQCERTNSNTLEAGMYGSNTAGMFGYSHFTGGFAGGQAEYVRVPYGDVNLLKLPDSVPDEKGIDFPSWSWFLVLTRVDRSLPFRRDLNLVELCRRHRC